MTMNIPLAAPSGGTPPPAASTAEIAPLACDLTAIAAAQRPHHAAEAAYLLGAGVLEQQELPDGYAFRYAAADYERVTAFIALERRCCPFFHFQLEVPPAGGPLWLRITGRPGVKAFLQANLGPIIVGGDHIAAKERWMFSLIKHCLPSVQHPLVVGGLSLALGLVLGLVAPSLGFYVSLGPLIMILLCLAPCLVPLLLLRRRNRAPAGPAPLRPLAAAEEGDPGRGN